MLATTLSLLNERLLRFQVAKVLDAEATRVHLLLGSKMGENDVSLAVVVGLLVVVVLGVLADQLDVGQTGRERRVLVVLQLFLDRGELHRMCNDRVVVGNDGTVHWIVEIRVGVQPLTASNQCVQRLLHCSRSSLLITNVFVVGCFANSLDLLDLGCHRPCAFSCYRRRCLC